MTRAPRIMLGALGIAVVALVAYLTPPVSGITRGLLGLLSAVALWCFVAMLFSGIINALVRIAPADLFSTSYGRLVIGKAVALALLGLIGWRQRRDIENGIVVESTHDHRVDLQRREAGPARGLAQPGAPKGLCPGLQQVLCG